MEKKLTFNYYTHHKIKLLHGPMIQASRMDFSTGEKSYFRCGASHVKIILSVKKNKL